MRGWLIGTGCAAPRLALARTTVGWSFKIWSTKLLTMDSLRCSSPSALYATPSSWLRVSGTLSCQKLQIWHALHEINMVSMIPNLKIIILCVYCFFIVEHLPFSFCIFFLLGHECTKVIHSVVPFYKPCKSIRREKNHSETIARPVYCYRNR